ncbi:MAG TPA: YggS family pyridoxal phosphate-dependent enzyme [Candidatus Saccharimonadales bacterium]|nr:YggS family pyridoxal phosphate-dependent enzyme [Candidatus Saccharimonadales bacterium]
MTDIAANLNSVRQRIAQASDRAGRDPEGVTLLAVSKGQPAETVRAAADLGLTLFGENRVQEGRAKIGLCPGRLRWHLIGHLQSNKCRDAVHFFEMIQSVDSLSLAREINNWAEKSAKTMPVLIEVNVAGESSKFGYAPEKVLAELKEINALPKIEVHGLMTVAPFSQDSGKVRPVFRRLRELKGQCEGILGVPLPHLSMGMSGDFEVAVEEGATIIRLGSAILGPRSAPKPPPADQ